MAAERGFTETVKALTKAGADVNLICKQVTLYCNLIFYTVLASTKVVSLFMHLDQLLVMN